jgi:nucleotide-binding universal stress UspA family protein
MISKIKRILVPTDFSTTSIKALGVAAKIADKLDAKITLLNVIDPPFNFPTNIEGVIDFLTENSEQHLAMAIDKVKKENPGKALQIKSQIRLGKPVSQILEAISDLKFDLVVMGSSTDAPTRKVIFGSVSTDILLRSPKPVLAIPENADEKNIQLDHLLFTTNFRHNDVENLADLAIFAKHFDASIEVLHIASEDDLKSDIKFRGFKQLVTEKNIYDKIRFEYVVKEDAFEGISEYIGSKPGLTIVMNRYRKSIVGLLVDKNYTKKLSVYSKVPLLVLMGDK